MLIVTDIRNIKNVKADCRYMIVRSMSRPIDGVKQWATLSPSRELWLNYLNWKKAGIWNSETFRSAYVPQFIREMRQPRQQEALAELHRKASTRDVAIACFCPDESLCHRSIIASLMAAAGIDVKMQGEPDPYYAELYRSMAAD